MSYNSSDLTNLVKDFMKIINIPSMKVPLRSVHQFRNVFLPYTYYETANTLQLAV